jgi:hypothetical protein
MNANVTVSSRRSELVAGLSLGAFGNTGAHAQQLHAHNLTEPLSCAIHAHAPLWAAGQGRDLSTMHVGMRLGGSVG